MESDHRIQKEETEAEALMLATQQLNESNQSPEIQHASNMTFISHSSAFALYANHRNRILALSRHIFATFTASSYLGNQQFCCTLFFLATSIRSFRGGKHHKWMARSSAGAVFATYLLDCFPHKILLIFDSEHSESTGRPPVKSILCQPN